MHYTEGRNVGYRWWIDTHHTPLFPFGFGLSYTTFHYAKPVVRVDQHGQNAGGHGARDGHATPVTSPVPMWRRSTSGSRRRPASRPASSRPTSGSTLRAGQRATVTFRLRGLQLAYFARGHWRIPAGRFRVFVGDSAAAAQLSAALPFHLHSTPVLATRG